MTGVQTETGVLAGDERMLIDGELQITGSKASFDVIHPASEEVAGRATDGSVDDMARAVGAARRAFDETDWSRDLEFRYHCLTQLHDALERHKERLRIYPEPGGDRLGVHVARLDPTFTKRTGLWLDPISRGHFAIRVDDLDPVRRRLEGHGIPYLDPGEFAVRGLAMIFVHDPAGNVVEINQAVEPHGEAAE